MEEKHGENQRFPTSLLFDSHKNLRYMGYIPKKIRLNLGMNWDQFVKKHY